MWPEMRFSPDRLHIFSGYTEAFKFASLYAKLSGFFCPSHVELVEYCGIDFQFG